MIEGHRPRPVVLCVLDGWGHRDDPHNNAILAAATPVWDGLIASCPNALLDASARQVGLPGGQMGNSEAGHMNLGAGRVVYQDLLRIDAALADGSLAANPALGDFIARLKASGGIAQLMGLVSPGGVHAHQNHIQGLAKLLGQAGLQVAIHAFLDGRDTPPRSAGEYLAKLIDDTAEVPGCTIATVIGRYYAMDRDQRWARTQRAYEALVEAKGERADDALAAVAQSYEKDISDEFTVPTVIGGYGGMADGDGVLMANFRPDRVRQILTALVDPGSDDFKRGTVVNLAAVLGMTEYSAALNNFVPTLFPSEHLKDTLGEVVAAAGMSQLRIAETEKYAHVTFFFNGGKEREFSGEKRILVPSPKVATYDLKPEMSAPEVTDRLIAAIESGAFDLIVVNYANVDMVGHTGNLTAAVGAVEAVDACLGRLVKAVSEKRGALLITADHGNAEMMSNPATGQSHTAHTRNPVPVILVGAGAGVAELRDGRLADVAPTVLNLMGLNQPAAMTGQSLIVPAEARRVAAAERASA